MHHIRVGQLSRKLVTVITPCLNAAETIDATLNSVARLAANLATHDATIEHLILDGGSTDSTLEKALRHADQYPFCTVKEGIAGGIYRAMNVGLSHAKGHFTHILNADDYILDSDSYLSLVCEGFNQKALVLLGGIAYFCRPSSGIKRVWQVHPLPGDRNIWREQLRSGLHYPHPGFIAQTEIYRQQGFDERYSLSADYKLMQSLLLCPDLATRVNASSGYIVAMAEGGATGGLRAILRGSQQIAAINRELGISESLWRRYSCKLWARLQPLHSSAMVGAQLYPPAATDEDRF